MRAVRYLVAILLGPVLGIGAAVHGVRAGALGSSIAIGSWHTGHDFGTASASAKTRAVVALGGLLALPAHEARYYTADTDDAGRPLDGHCRYRVSGGPLPARWWSLTLYDRAGYLVGAGPYSIESAAAPPGRWTATVGRGATGAMALDPGTFDTFALTLRLYLPTDGGKGDPPRAVLPSIMREGC